MRHLAVYGDDSDQRTLVGLGPVERVRRSRPVAEAPDSQRMPLSEPPGPFIADDDAALSFRKRALSGWRAALPAAILIALAGVGIARSLSDPTPSPLKLAPIAAAPELRAHWGAPGASALPPVPELDATPAESTEEAGARGDDDREEPAPERTGRLGEERGTAVLPPSAVQLPDVPTAAPLVDRASANDSNVGTINVTSNPPANVVLNGRPVGKAPRVVRVPAGAHTLVFIHPLYGRRSMTVSVKSGATTSASADF
jgi:hypothetical protein